LSQDRSRSRARAERPSSIRRRMSRSESSNALDVKSIRPACAREGRDAPPNVRRLPSRRTSRAIDALLSGRAHAPDHPLSGSTDVAVQDTSTLSHDRSTIRLVRRRNSARTACSARQSSDDANSNPRRDPRRCDSRCLDAAVPNSSTCRALETESEPADAVEIEQVQRDGGEQKDGCCGAADRRSVLVRQRCPQRNHLLLRGGQP
jgi:hypothetical protein